MGMKILFLGDAPGQAECVLIGKLRFRRGEIYEFDEELAERLLAKGGFEVVKPPRAPRSKVLDLGEKEEGLGVDDGTSQG